MHEVGDRTVIQLKPNQIFTSGPYNKNTGQPSMTKKDYLELRERFFANGGKVIFVTPAMAAEHDRKQMLLASEQAGKGIPRGRRSKKSKTQKWY
jgi:hypothetical protein